MSESFVYEVSLAANPCELGTLGTRLEAGRQLYHTCLGEALKRISRIRQSRDWTHAKTLPKSKERSALFKKAIQDYKFTDYDLQDYACRQRKTCFIQEHIDSSTAQKISTRAFLSASTYLQRKRGKPRFKGKGQFVSIEGKSNQTGIRFKEGCIVWNGLKLKCLFDSRDKDEVEAHALQGKTKYVRLVRKIIRGKILWYAQLIQEGKPLIKKRHLIAKNQVVGTDQGPSTIAIVSDKQALLTPFCPKLIDLKRKNDPIQRRLDRKRKLLNPERYSPNGVPIKGLKTRWKFSNRYFKDKHLLSELHRRLAASRKTQHGELINKILSQGTIIKTEKLSYKKLQNQFGRSISLRAPGLFIERLRRKAENAGGELIEFPAYKFRLSQLCHGCGNHKKKPLNQRWHYCSCGTEPVQRDLYSGYLCKYVEKETFDRSQARKDWPSAEPLLRQALSECNQTAIGKLRFASFGLSQRQSCLPVENGSMHSKIKDVVRPMKIGAESLEELSPLAVRTP